LGRQRGKRITKRESQVLAIRRCAGSPIFGNRVSRESRKIGLIEKLNVTPVVVFRITGGRDHEVAVAISWSLFV